jgi:hypothetical protein
MKKLNGLLQSIIIALSIYLLYRLFSKEDFVRMDYILMIIDCIAGFIILILETNRKKNERRSLN